ncbi:MAG TPA: 50S ribosomal protein L11 methyltransferase, partial [Bryobacteraceae bacterium]|nr:50S ribosomal protein L11 methyltransferase [Bryobacteraceae bacterium]
PAPCGRVRLRTYPGMACGTGAHPATQLCLQAMERYPLEGKRVLDVGTGSGILAQAARLLGGYPVIGCDIDHASTLVAAVNIGKSILPVALFTGSVRSVKSGAIDLVLANLNAATLKQIAGDLNRIAAPAAVLILSGFLHSEAQAVAEAVGRVPREALQLHEWSCLVL